MTWYSCLLRLLFCILYVICVCKSSSTDENKEFSWDDPTGMKAELSLNALCSRETPEGCPHGIYPDCIVRKISGVLPFKSVQILEDIANLWCSWSGQKPKPLDKTDLCLEFVCLSHNNLFMSEHKQRHKSMV